MSIDYRKGGKKAQEAYFEYRASSGSPYNLSVSSFVAGYNAALCEKEEKESMKSKTIVEMYVLWIDKTWSVEQVELDGIHESKKAESLARRKIISEMSVNGIEAIGPLYYYKVENE